MEHFFQIISEAARATSVYEWGAFITAILYVVLAAKENILCWLMALISTALYFYVCLGAKLYLETILQAFYFVMGIYGWWQWKHRSVGFEDLKVISLPVKKILMLLLPGLIFSPVIGFLFANYTDASQPYLDAAITTFSFIATWMVAKKILQNWIFWIVIDAAAILLYTNKQLYLTSLLYLIYTVFSFYGYYEWNLIIKKRKD